MRNMSTTELQPALRPPLQRRQERARLHRDVKLGSCRAARRAFACLLQRRPPRRGIRPRAAWRIAKSKEAQRPPRAAVRDDRFATKTRRAERATSRPALYRALLRRGSEGAAAVHCIPKPKRAWRGAARRKA